MAKGEIIVTNLQHQLQKLDQHSGSSWDNAQLELKDFRNQMILLIDRVKDLESRGGK
ncbi:MAG: hypothetical protein HY399_01925 [Elusimicrobia bacterium]|nr:hypothetical protein [Elusimicrobiota bacterium]